MTVPSSHATVTEVSTPVGAARVHAFVPVGSRPGASVVLGHGAGGGVEARDLAALAAALPLLGHGVVLVEQPWAVAGRRVAGPPPQLDAAWTAVLEALPSLTDVAHPLVVGGRSAGARVACRTAGAVGADLVLALAFPLHPPGRPERSRADELLGAGVPVLVVQGERDAFGRPDELPRGPQVVAVPGADHGFAVARSAVVTQEEALDLLVDGVGRWLAGKTRRAS